MQNPESVQIPVLTCMYNINSRLDCCFALHAYITTRHSIKTFDLTDLTLRHNGAGHENSHAWLRSLFPYSSLQEFEQAWHMGNYVLDRKTGEKTFEEMSIYVRVRQTHI